MHGERLAYLETLYNTVADSKASGFLIKFKSTKDDVEFEITVSRRAIGQMLSTEIAFIKNRMGLLV